VSATSGDLTHVNLCALSDGYGFVSTIALQINDRALSRRERDRSGLIANPSVYTPVREPIAYCWREKEVVQPHPFV
jgi:hypothetical protein